MIEYPTKLMKIYETSVRIRDKVKPRGEWQLIRIGPGQFRWIMDFQMGDTCIPAVFNLDGADPLGEDKEHTVTMMKHQAVEKVYIKFAEMVEAGEINE